MKTTIKAVRDGEETPLLELDGPFPTDRSKYGPGWFRYSFQLLEPGREARSGEVHASQDEGLLGAIFRIEKHLREWR
ncbi:hypothetical protein [Ectopseudomonas oleovorans]|jgi:hypothetical protein|uniref:hypothetical protein n=1 Tax=Ectopseudomonas oleovorans TaxID=301 RepID=UPI0035B4DCA8